MLTGITLPVRFRITRLNWSIAMAEGGGTSSFEMGDVLIFGMYTMHASLDNTTNRFRLSTDTRYQRADEPVDERWIGDNPIAHYAWTKGETVPMEEMRKRWGV